MATIIRAAGKITDRTGTRLYPRTLLDSIANVDRIYSMRKATNQYSGALIQVRRASDSSVLDVKASTSGGLDTAALLSFAGTGDAFVQRFYDQGPRAKHLTQATAANQPKVVSAGALVTLGGKPAAAFDGVDDHLFDGAPALWAAGSATVAAVLSGTQAAQSRWYCESGYSTGHQYGLAQPDAAVTARWQRAWPVITDVVNQTATAVPAANLLVFNGQPHQFTAADTGTTLSQWVDGVEDYSGFAYTRVARSIDRFALGGVSRSSSLAPIPMTFSEAVFVAGSLTASQRSALEAEQRTFYGTPA